MFRSGSGPVDSEEYAPEHTDRTCARRVCSVGANSREPAGEPAGGSMGRMGGQITIYGIRPPNASRKGNKLGRSWEALGHVGDATGARPPSRAALLVLAIAVAARSYIADILRAPSEIREERMADDWAVSDRKLHKASVAAIRRFARENPNDEVCCFFFDCDEPRYGMVSISLDTLENNVRVAKELEQFAIESRRENPRRKGSWHWAKHQ